MNVQVLATEKQLVGKTMKEIVNSCGLESESGCRSAEKISASIALWQKDNIMSFA